MKRFLFLCGMLAICMMATATEMKGANFDNDVGIVQQDYNYINDFSASVINIESPATVLTEYQLVNTQDLALAGLSTIIEATPCKDFNRDYNQYQTVAVEGKDYNENSPPNRWSSEMIYGNDTSAPTNF
jgi:hypothetical protein